MGYAPAPPPSLPPPKRNNCLKPIIGCTMGPLLLLTVVVGCVGLCLTFVASRGPESPLGDDFEPDPTAAAQYEEDILNDLADAAGSETFSISIEQEALSSWINLNYEDVFERYEVSLPDYWDYADPTFQIGFDDNRIYFYVSNDVPLVNLGTLVTAEVFPPNAAFTNYLIGIDILRIEAGGFRLDEDSATISARLSEIITDRIEYYRDEAGLGTIAVTAVQAREGILTISGTISPQE